jgi:hypothetical protein
VDKPVLVDEQGDYWPPPTALAAFLEGYGGSPDYDGLLVEVSAFLPEQNMFETASITYYWVDGKSVAVPGEVLYVYAHELRPINKGTQAYIKAVTEVAVEMYDVDVYDLRDALAQIDINVKASSVASWDGRQRGRVEAYVLAVLAQSVHPNINLPSKPSELP